MKEQICLFTPVHKGLRHALAHATMIASSLDYEKDADLKQFLLKWDEIVELLHFHAVNEDSHVQLPLEKFQPILAQKLEAEHELAEDMLEDVVQVSLSLSDADKNSRKELGIRFVKTLNRFVAMYLTHLETEESEVMPALRETLTLEELQQLSANMRSAVPSNLMMKYLHYMLPAMNIHERVQMLTAIQQNTAEEAFNTILTIAANTLSADDWKELQTKLAQTV
ncbi:hypothetical protein EJF36_15480 [Bacillus sp. HMF5848]|uniref:hemerythrin domain-containing protein n=1 Tax=Bacillus sp. HMF5848 TaxID=2495421 RepID=UPI000F783BF0|nr:hemerythrin domain-containing protein [Bacillus sp. HMF5848]RSK28171.1 hypothetical protein EJF36_15480 [Bacillus sp. HMF5848]